MSELLESQRVLLRRFSEAESLRLLQETRAAEKKKLATDRILKEALVAQHEPQSQLEHAQSEYQDVMAELKPFL